MVAQFLSRLLVLIIEAGREGSALLAKASSLVPFLHSPLPGDWVSWSPESVDIVRIAPVLALLVFAAFLARYWLRERAIRRVTGETFSPRTWLLLASPALCFALALFFGLVAAAGPNLYETSQEIKYDDACAAAGLDLSLSSNAGLIGENGVRTRLDMALDEMRGLTRIFTPDKDYLGLMKFSHRVLQSPIFSSDFNIFLARLDRKDDLALAAQRDGRRGSDIVGATRNMLRSFPADIKCQRFVIVFTDGEQNFGGTTGTEAVTEEMLEELRNSAEAAKAEAEAQVFLVIVGTPDETWNVPEYDNEGNLTGFASTMDGQIISTTADTSVATQVVEAIGGTVIVAEEEDLGDVLSAEVAKRRNVAEVRSVSIPWSAAPFFAGFAAVFLATGWEVRKFLR